MRKFTLKLTSITKMASLLLILLLASLHSNAQYPASSYSLSYSTDSFVDIAGTTGEVLLPNSFMADDAISGSIPLGFTLNYCGFNYTNMIACSNGWMSFNTATTSAQYTNSFANLTGNSLVPILMALWDDLGGSTSTANGGRASYVTTGTGTNHVFTFQWKNWGITSSGTKNISFQIKLYESTNVIRYVYRQEVTSGSLSSATIGIADGSTTPTYLTLNNASAAPTASSTSFGTSITARPATNQNYIFTPPPPCTTISTWPTATTATVTPASICGIGTVNLNMTTATAMPATTGLTYQWQSSPNNASPWTNVGTPQTTPAYTTSIGSSVYFRCLVLCNGTTTVITSSSTPQLSVSNPGTVTTTGASRCGPGSVSLTATPSIAGNTVHWYTAATGGAPIGTGSPFTTPYVPATTTFYAASEVNTPVTGAIGTATTTVPVYTYPTAFGNYWYQTWSQMVYTVAELQAAGLSAGSISAVTFKILSQPSPNTNPTNYSISMGPTTNNTLSAFTTTGLTQVYSSASQSCVVGDNTLTFTTPYIWDGVSNIVLDIRETESYGSGNAATYYTNTTGNTVVYAFTTSNNPNFWTSNPSVTTSTQRLNVKFAGTGTCSNARVPAVATINASPAISIARPAITCSNEIGQIAATSTPMSNYSTYSWAANVTDLYSNAAGTTPYVSGSSPSVYLKSSTNGTHTFYLFSSGATAAACTHADTISVWVQPDSITILGAPDSICAGGTSTLSLMPSTGYAANSIQWQESSNGSTYANIAGATTATYTTPTITANHYYRALIKSTNDTCEMPVKYVVVVNPQLISAPDSFSCGPGPVTLIANTGGNSTAKWYNSASGGNPVATGNVFVTPYLGTTQTYYVSAEGGAATPNLVQDGTGTSSDGGLNYTAGIYSAYYASTMQMLYTAAEITAAGGTAGNLSSISFNCTGLPANALANYKIAIKFVPATMTTLTQWQTGMTDVYTNTSLLPTATGWNTYPFTALQGWNGTDNIVVQVCKDNNSYSGTGNHQYTSKASRTLYYFNYTTTACGQTGTSTSSNLPNIKFGIQPVCGTPRTLVHAYVYPKPVVDLGPDLNMCVDQDAAYVLNAGAQPNTPQYLWDDNSTSQVRAVSHSGTYSVKVTNQYTCFNSDTVNITLRHNPVIDLGNDTTVCNGVDLALDPGNTGIEYFWSTGQTGETITVNAAGSYNVFVTNADGCTSLDTIQVTMQGELPTIQGIQVSNNGQYQFHFTAVNPQNVIGYDWDFGDSTAHSYLANPTHTYSDNGNYTVVLRLSSTCGYLSDTIGAHIVGIHQITISNDELSVYPNPTKNNATISVNGDLKMERIEVYNMLGQIIYKNDADSKTKHTLNLNGFASGMYTIQIYTDKGTVARKLEILK